MQLCVHTFIGLKVQLGVERLVQMVALSDHFLHLAELLDVFFDLHGPRRLLVRRQLLESNQLLALSFLSSAATFRVGVRLQ